MFRQWQPWVGLFVGMVTLLHVWAWHYEAWDFSARHGLRPAIALFLAMGAPPDTWDEYDATALHWAASRNDVAMIRMLVRAGAKVNARCHVTAETPLHVAAAWGHLEAIRELVSGGADLEAPAVYGLTPMGNAARYVGKEAIEALLDAGAKPNLVCLAVLGDVARVRQALDRGDKVNRSYNVFYRPLAYAVESDNLQVAQLLLERHADANCGDNYGFPALAWAVSRGDLAMVQLLLAHGARPNQRDPALHHTPLHVAAMWGRVDIIAELLRGKADPNLRDYCGERPLDYAIRYGHDPAADALRIATQSD